MAKYQTEYTRAYFYKEKAQMKTIEVCLNANGVIVLKTCVTEK